MSKRKYLLRSTRGLTSLVLMLAAMPASSESTDYTDVPLSELVQLDIYAPSVLRSHLHEKGEWMLGYEFMTMSMEGSREGTDNLSDQDVFKVEGAIVNLFRKGTRQKFGVDRKAAMQAGLTLSSQLLQIASVVN